MICSGSALLAGSCLMREPVTTIAPVSSLAAFGLVISGALCAQAGDARAPRATPLVRTIREMLRVIMKAPNYSRIRGETAQD